MTIPEICERLERQAEALNKMEVALNEFTNDLQTLRHQLGVGTPNPNQIGPESSITQGNSLGSLGCGVMAKRY